jgi:endonuclease-3
MTQQKAAKILQDLRAKFGEHPKCELLYNSAWSLLTAIILSAQCTDKRVNLTTPILFKRFPDIKSIADSNVAVKEIEDIIKPCGFYKEKAKHIKNTAVKIMNEFNGEVPKTIAELMTLPGVGEKTASVFVAEFYNIPAIAVDTHVTRVSFRLGLSKENKPGKIARDLEKLFERGDWRDVHLLLVLFGRYICTAKKPKCSECPFNESSRT